MSRLELPELPALVVGRVSHTRRVPLRHSFSYRCYQWLVEVDRLPRLPWWLRPLAGFRAADHFDGGTSIRGDLATFLAGHGIELDAADRVVMLAHARVFGHVFNPLSVFWVLRETGEVRAVVLEVHNTYGQRHSYLLQVDAAGHATTDKVFYVSPFNDVSGRYQVRLRLRPDRVGVTVGLDRAGTRVMTATSGGTVRPATSAAVLRVGLSHLLMTQRVSALIRLHGIRLWLRRLPIQPRPAAGPSLPRPGTTDTEEFAA